MSRFQQFINGLSAGVFFVFLAFVTVCILFGVGVCVTFVVYLFRFIMAALPR